MNAIMVSGLVKRFGAYTAVDGVSFETPSGQVGEILQVSTSYHII